MEKFKNKYRNSSARKPNYDYASNGSYFVTICTDNKIRYFGNINNNGEMNLNEIGKMVHKFWYEIPNHFNNVVLDEFVIMPDHVHGIIMITNETCRDVAMQRPYVENGSTKNQFFSNISPKPKSLPTIVRSFKSIATREIRKNYRKMFTWQPRYYDRIIRDDEEFYRIQVYIKNNPKNWLIKK